MLPVTWRGVPATSALVEEASRVLLALEVPRRFFLRRSLPRSSGRLAGVRRGSLGPASTPRRCVDRSALRMCCALLPGVLWRRHLVAPGSPLCVMVGWQPLCGRGRGACVYTWRVVSGSSGRGCTLWRRTSCFFVPVGLEQNGAASPPPRVCRRTVRPRPARCASDVES